MAKNHPFDERQVFLRFLRNFKWIVLATIAGTLLLGALYVVKNILLSGPAQYEACGRYQVSYVVDYHDENDYYINAYTWNDYLHSDGFMAEVSLLLADRYEGSFTKEELVSFTTADVEADFHVVTMKVVTTKPELTMALSEAIEETMTGYFPEVNEQLQSIAVLDKAVLKQVPLTARPVRAFLLAAVVSFFFATVIYLLWEIGTDSLWIPGVITREYELPCVGTMCSMELGANLAHLFDGEMYVVPCLEDMDPAQITKELRGCFEGTIVAVPDPCLEPDTVQALQGKSALLVVPAGSNNGKPMERRIEFLRIQNVDIKGILLWDADEWLIKSYYRIAGEAARQ